MVNYAVLNKGSVGNIVGARLGFESTFADPFQAFSVDVPVCNNWADIGLPEAVLGVILDESDDAEARLDRRRVQAVGVAGLDRGQLIAVAENGRVRIDVIDQGPGVSPQLASRLFQRGVRGHHPGGPAGLGLGLYSVRRVMELHRGRVLVVEPPPTSGLTIRLVIEQETGE